MDIDGIVRKVIYELSKPEDGIKKAGIHTGISNRHVHLSESHLKALFGEGASLTKLKDLSQTGQFSCEECVTIAGTKGCIEKVRILGPVRRETQVEILASDCYRLGVFPPVRESGKIENTPGIAIIGTKGCIQVPYGVIIPQRHIHMNFDDASRYSCGDGQIVSVEFKGIRGGRMDNVVVRVSDKFVLDFHIDFDEANSFGIKEGDTVSIIK